MTTTLTPEQQALRSTGIGSSEIAGLVGHSPFLDAHTIWRRKTGREEFSVEGPQIERGVFLEAGILNWYAHRTGRQVETPTTKHHSDYPHVVDSVDGIAVQDGRRVAALEVKCVDPFAAGRSWGDPEEGHLAVPVHYYLQGMWHCGVWGLPVVEYPVFFGRDMVIYHAQFDPELFRLMAEQAEMFWEKHVVADLPPPVGPCEATEQWIRKQFPTSEPGPYADADTDSTAWAVQLRDTRQQIKRLEESKAALENALKFCIGSNEGIKGLDEHGRPWSISYKGSNVKRVDWDQVKKRSRISDHVLKSCTSEKYVRRFVPRFS